MIHQHSYRAKIHYEGMYYPDYLRQCNEVRLLLKDNGISFKELTTGTGYKIFEFDDEADRFFFLLTYHNAKTFDPIDL